MENTLLCLQAGVTDEDGLTPCQDFMAIIRYCVSFRDTHCYHVLSLLQNDEESLTTALLVFKELASTSPLNLIPTFVKNRAEQGLTAPKSGAEIMQCHTHADTYTQGHTECVLLLER